MSSPLQRAYRFCLGDGSLTLAVFILIFFVFVLYPMVEVGVVRRVWLDVAFAAFLAMGAVFVFEPRPLVRLFLVFLGGAVVVSLVDHVFASSWLSAFRSLLTMVATALLGALLLASVMRDGRMNLNRIMGAIGSYLLIGIVFTQAYRLLAGFVPGAFAIGGTPADFETIGQKLSYFSFITLTSTGYGDITPLHPYARSLATLEALAGNLFLTVLVARLVGQEIDWRHEQRDLRREQAADAKKPGSG
jgi:voltage-gated potassium channel Kch